jgi:hypothetical protein
LGRSTAFALALVLLSTACNRGHRKGEPAYVSAPQAILHDRVPPCKQGRHGKQRRARGNPDRDKRFAMVRTANGMG